MTNPSKERRDSTKASITAHLDTYFYYTKGHNLKETNPSTRKASLWPQTLYRRDHSKIRTKRPRNSFSFWLEQTTDTWDGRQYWLFSLDQQLVVLQYFWNCKLFSSPRQFIRNEIPVSQYHYRVTFERSEILVTNYRLSKTRTNVNKTLIRNLFAAWQLE